MSTVVALFQPKGDDPGAEREHVALLVRLVAARGYKSAEIAHAMHEMPYDEDMNAKLRYRSPVTPADFEACINRVREHRAMLRTPQSEEKVRAMLSKYPELVRENWKQCKFDDRGNPLYLYVEPKAKP